MKELVLLLFHVNNIFSDPSYQGSSNLSVSSLSRRRKIRVTPDVLSSIATDTDTATDTTLTEQMYTARDSSASPGGSDTELDDTFMPEMDSPDELEDSILECRKNFLHCLFEMYLHERVPFYGCITVS